MNEKQLIIEVIKKYKLQQPVADSDQDRILKSKKNALKRIIQEEKSPSLLFPFAFNLYYWLKDLGLSISFKNSLRMTYATSAMLAILIVMTTTIIVKNHLYQDSSTSAYIAQGHVINATGDVSIQVNNKKNAQINIQDLIKENRIITTGPEGNISIQLAEIGVISLLPGTTASFHYIDHKNKHIEVNLREGVLFSNIIKNFGGIYRVKTPACLAIARGTQYLTTYKDNKAEVKLLEGKVGLKTSHNIKKETALIENHSAVISTKHTINIQPLNSMDKLELKKMTLHAYIVDIKSKTKNDIESINKTIKTNEAKINRQIALEYKQIHKTNDLSPLDRLRKRGKPLTMFDLRDNTKIAGNVLSQTKSHIILDTGDGIVKVPINEVIRRLPLD